MVKNAKPQKVPSHFLCDEKISLIPKPEGGKQNNDSHSNKTSASPWVPQSSVASETPSDVTSDANVQEKYAGSSGSKSMQKWLPLYTSQMFVLCL